MRRHPVLLAIAAVISIVSISGCSTSVPTDTPGVDRVGGTSLRYRGPEIEMVVSYRFASANLGIDWLILDAVMTGAAGDPVEVKRDRIFVRTPDNEAVYLASQEEFGKAYSGLRPTLVRASVGGEPIDYWTGRTECGLQFFAEPGTGITYPLTTLNDRRVCYGRLYFLLPKGVQAGTYVLGVDLPESKIRVPFKLGEKS